MQRARKSSLLPLGIFFLIVAAACAIGGFANIQEPAAEKSNRQTIRYHDAEHSKYTERFMNDGAEYSYAAKLADQYVNPITDTKVELEKLQHEREMRKLYCFVPGGLLAIIGLICCAAGSNRALPKS